MTQEKFLEIFNDEDNKIKRKWDGDNALQGLLILAKYIDPTKKDIICGADHDIIYGPEISDLVDGGITEEDVIKLKSLNWGLSDDNYCLTCFV